MRFENVEVVGKVYKLNRDGSIELIGEVIPEGIISERGKDEEKREEAR